MRDSVPSVSYSSICNVLCQWSISLIPNYRVYRLYDYYSYCYYYCYILLLLLLQKYKKRKLTATSQPANSAGEAIERMLVEKRLSAKINYDVLKSLDRGLFEPLGGNPSSPCSGLSSSGATAGTTLGATTSTIASTMAGATVEEVTRQAIAGYEKRLGAHPASPLLLPPTTPGGAGGSPLDISHSPPHKACRLPSLQSRKRPFSPFVGGSGPTVPSPK